MFWLQALLCFALWIAYGIWQMRRSSGLRAKLERIPRTKRALLGVGLMLGGAGVLFFALVLGHAFGGFSGAGMSTLTWISVAVCGLAFVYAQTLSMAILVTLAYEGAVTSSQNQASEHNGSDPGNVKP